MKKYLLLLVTVSLIHAATTSAAGLHFNPTGGTYGKGSTLKVNISVNTSGEAVNAVQANFSYPANLLQFQSVSTSGSALTIIAERAGGGGFVKLAGGAPNPGFTGSKYLGTAYFKVLSDTGSATLSFMSDSAVLRNSDNQNVLSSRSSANFNFSKALPTAPPPTPLQLGLATASPSINQVSISWTTNQPSTSIVEYGLDTNYGLATSSSELSTNHQLTLTTFLVPGITYHYRVRSADATGTETLGPDLTFVIPGATNTQTEKKIPPPSSSFEFLPVAIIFLSGLIIILVTVMLVRKYTRT